MQYVCPGSVDKYSKSFIFIDQLFIGIYLRCAFLQLCNQIHVFNIKYTDNFLGGGNMNSQELLKSIANGIYAAEKIRNIQNSTVRQDPNVTVRPSNMARLGEMLQVIAEYYPGNKKKLLEEATYIGNIYSNAYRSLKYYLMESRNKGADMETFLKALNSIKPVLSNNHKIVIDKMTKIYEIITS